MDLKKSKYAISHFGINKQFIGLGHQLEREKKQRKLIEDKNLMMRNRVLYFRKQQQQTNKEISENKTQLIKFIKSRIRKEEQQKKKQQISQFKKLQLDFLRQKSRQMKTSNQKRLQKSYKQLQNKNKTTFMMIKQQLAKQFAWKKKHDTQLRKLNNSRFQNIQNDKKKGRQNIDQYFKRKNFKAVQYYKNKIKEQKQYKSSLSYHIKELQSQEKQLILQLEKSQIQNNSIKEVIRNRHNIQFDKLQKIFEKKRSKRGRFNSKQKTEHDSESNRKYIQKSLSHRKSQLWQAIATQAVLITSENNNKHQNPEQKLVIIKRKQKNQKNPEFLKSTEI